MSLLYFVLSLLIVSTNGPAAWAQGERSAIQPNKKNAQNQVAKNKVDRVLFLVFDAFRPDYVDRYDLKNFKKLRLQSEHYSKAWLGHLFSETVVAHAVLPTGLQPKDLPWADDLMRDGPGILGKPGAYYLTGDLTIDQFHALMKSRIPEEVFLQKRLKDEFGGKVVAVGAKSYAAAIFGGPYADHIVTFKKENGVCRPYGIMVPEYILSDERFTVSCGDDYGTGLGFYPLDGNRHIPGPNLGALLKSQDKHSKVRADEKWGGDIWVVDVAKKVMDQEDWSGLFLTFSGVDKVSHLLGDHEKVNPRDFDSPITQEQAIRVADVALGMLIEHLKAKNLYDRTLIVLTADHGGQRDAYYFGVDGKAHYGKNILNDSERDKRTSFWIEQLGRQANVAATYHDTAVRVWLDDQSENNIKKVQRGLAQMSGVVSVHQKQRTDSGYSYVTTWIDLSDQSLAFRTWHKKTTGLLLQGLANSDSPEFVALLQDGVGYGLIGDHGGAQEKVQRVPLYIRVPGRPGRHSSESMPQYRLKGIVEKALFN